jgi:allophanate hydrolase subunit 2
MATYPKDQFDDLPADAPRVGAHRGPARRGGGWITFAWAALATGVLVAAGVGGFSLLGAAGDSQVADPVITATATATATPITDPTTIAAKRDISITMLNGTDANGLAQKAEKALVKDKWPVTSAADAESTSHKSTIIYYSNADDEDVARGVAIELTVGTISLDTTMQGAPIKVVLGADYKALQ